MTIGHANCEDEDTKTGAGHRFPDAPVVITTLLSLLLLLLLMWFLFCSFVFLLVPA